MTEKDKLDWEVELAGGRVIHEGLNWDTEAETVDYGKYTYMDIAKRVFEVMTNVREQQLARLSDVVSQ